MPEENIQQTFQELYARAKRREVFTDLMPIVLNRENILLAYRNIKSNSGNNTPGTDGLRIKDIERLTAEEVIAKIRLEVSGRKDGYQPKPVRRKDIPKPNGKTRPLGIPCIWDRLIQQCFKQVLEPICEAHFSKHSYVFRPNRSVENAMADVSRKIQTQNLHYVIEFDIKGFFDNVNHSKLMRQMWTLGIRDKHLLGKIKRILKAPVKLPNGKLLHPRTGTPQGGIISPLLANIVLNELDHWVESNWEENPVAYKYYINENGGKGAGYRAMRKTRLKEMYIVRYADDFRIFCRTKTEAERTKIAITRWLSERLKLEVNAEKTRVVNIKRRYSEFLGLKIKVRPKARKLVVESHVSDKQVSKKTQVLKRQIKRIARPRTSQVEEIWHYNKMVLGMQNYYQVATCVNLDFSKIAWQVDRVRTNRLKGLSQTGRKLTPAEKKRYGKSKMLRYLADEPLYPIGYVQHRNPMHKKNGEPEFDSARNSIVATLMNQPLYGRSIEYADNRISLFFAQNGRCAVTGQKFESTEEIHCHHKIPKSKGGTDEYDNLILVTEPVHKLIHATIDETIAKYLKLCSPDMKKLNELRKLIGNKHLLGKIED